ncbi:MAG: sensor histidine kinase [Desulfococcaceae bacterium]
MKSRFEVLRSVPFFDNLSDAEIREMADSAADERFSAGAVILREGEPGDRFFVVRSGQVEIWKDHGAAEADRLAVYGPGDIFGELALIDSAPRSAGVVARTEVSLLSVNRKNFHRIVRDSPAVSLCIMRAIAALIRRRTNGFVERLRRRNRSLKRAYARLKQAAEERREMEERLRHTQKMEAIATLSGGIAHDVNNLLMSIQGNVSLMRMRMDPNDPLYPKLLAIEADVEAGGTLTQKLLGFSRNGNFRMDHADIRRIVSRGLEEMEPLPADVHLETDFSDAPWPVSINPDSIRRALCHLCDNAREAMAEGGTLALRIRNLELDAPSARRLRLPAGPYVAVSVGDNGPGVDFAIRHRIFDPFFTTKPVGRGAGLGLSWAFNAVKNHGGAIGLESPADGGAIFTIYLPAAV